MSIASTDLLHNFMQAVGLHLSHTKDHHKNGTNGLPAWHINVWVAV